MVSGYHQPGNPALEKLANAHAQDKDYQRDARRRDPYFYWVGIADSVESVHQPNRSGLEEHGKMNTDAYQKTLVVRERVDFGSWPAVEGWFQKSGARAFTQCGHASHFSFTSWQDHLTLCARERIFLR